MVKPDDEEVLPDDDDTPVTKGNLREMLSELLPEFLTGDNDDDDDEVLVDDDAGQKATMTLKDVEDLMEKNVAKVVAALEAKKEKAKKAVKKATPAAAAPVVEKPKEEEPPAPAGKVKLGVRLWGRDRG